MGRTINNYILPQLLIVILSGDIMVSTDIEKSRNFSQGQLTVCYKKEMSKPNPNSNHPNLTLILILIKKKRNTLKRSKEKNKWETQ